MSECQPAQTQPKIERGNAFSPQSIMSAFREPARSNVRIPISPCVPDDDDDDDFYYSLM